MKKKSELLIFLGGLGLEVISNYGGDLGNYSLSICEIHECMSKIVFGGNAAFISFLCVLFFCICFRIS